MSWLGFLAGFGACALLLIMALFCGLAISEWLSGRQRANMHSVPLRKAVTLLREVRGTLRTDQYDGHVRIAVKIDDFLRSQP